jgi:hypothetical protein
MDIDVDKIVARAREFVASEEGRKRIAESIKRVNEITRQLKEARKVRPESLNRIIDI